MTTVAKKPLTKQQMRVAIAKDVIAQVRRRKLTPIVGSYVDGINPCELQRGESLQPQVEDVNCRVCAKGALFIAHVRRFNRVTAPGWYGYDEEFVCKPLLRYFGKRQLTLIEQYYEKWGTLESEDDCGNRLKPDRQKKFERANRSKTARLIAIMRNIVRNKGEFIP